MFKNIKINIFIKQICWFLLLIVVSLIEHNILGGFNLKIYSQNIYEIIENGLKKHIIIIYNISENHYVGLSIHTNKTDNFIYLKSVNRFVDINSLQEYSKKNIQRFSLC